MFKSMSEILFAPRSTTRDGGETPDTEMADPAFAELLKDAADSDSVAATDAILLAAALQVALPQPITPTGTEGMAGVAAVENNNVSMLPDEPNLQAMAPPPTTGTPAESASQLLAMIFGASAVGLPADTGALSSVTAKDPLGGVTTAIAPDVAPFDQFAAMPPPPTTGAAEPASGLERPGARTPPEPLLQAPPPTPKETATSANEATDRPPADVQRLTDPHAAKAEPRPIVSGPAPMIRVEATTRSDRTPEKSDKDNVLQLTTDLAVGRAPASVRVTAPRPDEGKTQFLWRQAMQAEAAAEPVADAPLPAAIEEPDKPVADTRLTADRQGDPAAAPSDVAAPSPDMDGRPDAVTDTLPNVETPKQDAPAVPGGVLILTQTDRVLPSSIPPATAQHHGVATPVQQVVETLATQPTDLPGRIELTLTPETLGKVHFDMRPEGGSLSIVLSAERADTLDLMRRHLPELMAELKQAGIQAGSFSFSSWNDGQRGQAPQPEMTQGEHIAGSGVSPAVPPRPTRTLGALGGLDIRF